MPVRKLVELDGEYGGMLEIDLVKLKRVAHEFKAWLLTLDRNNDPFHFLDEDLPLVEAALVGNLALPYRGSEPHTYEWREGLLPKEYRKYCAPFYNTIRGSLYEVPEVIRKDGRYYAWVDFESPSDFPASGTYESHVG